MKVKVWNDDVKDYSEEFNGKMITIPAGEYVVMERGDAVTFMGKYKPISIDPRTGKHMGFKKLRREFVEEDTPLAESKKHTCMIDGQEFTNEEELIKHVKDNHMDKIVDKKSKEEFTKKLKKKRR